MDSDVNGCVPDSLIGAGLAQRLVILHDKGTSRDGCFAFLALEALPMPLGVEGHDRVLRNGSFAIAAAGGEHMLEVCPAVGKPIVLVEGGARQLLHAGSAAQETFLMPRLTHGLDGALQNGTFAAVTDARVVRHEAGGADGLTLIDVEGGLGDGTLAVLADEVLRMPGLAQSGNDAQLDDLIALVTDGRLLRHFVCCFLLFLLARALLCVI